MQKSEILSRIRQVTHNGEWHIMKEPINDQTINEALKTYHNVKIPNIGKRIVLYNPIILSSDNHLIVDEKQVIMQAKGTYTCLMRNESIQDGAQGTTDVTKRDRNISVEGGIWNFRPKDRCYTDKEKSMIGSNGGVIFSGVEQISLKNMRIFDSEACGVGENDASYGLQIGDCKHFCVENIDFEGNGRDGVHLNGPAEYGYIRHIRGEKMGDDMVALNAWDWNNAALTFGTIQKVVVEDVKGPGNELRLLPGQKIYDDGTKVDCDICDCVLQNISGAYTFKMYAQPNILNAEIGTKDVSGTVGKMERIMFKDICFAKVTPAGFHGLPVKSLFEICSDCSEVYIEDVQVSNTLEQCKEMDLRLVNVGPLSAVWKNGSDDPADWGEVFDPDAICTLDNLYLKNISFQGIQVTDTKELVREVKMEINSNYPETTPRGGTGYGTIKRVYCG